MDKLISAEQAANLIDDNATLSTGGFIGIGFAETLAKAIEKRFLATGHPRNLSLVYAAGQGDAQTRGLNHFAHKGLIKKVLGGHWGLAPGLGRMAMDNEIAAYNLPQGVICHLYRDIAAGKPGTLTRVGLHTFVDPRQDGGKVNSVSEEDHVQLMPLNGEEYLFYKSFPLDVALLRGTTADAEGNISMEREALPLDGLVIAQAVRNSGGKVFVQVERLTERHQLTPDRVRIPASLVDYVIVAPAEDHPQTFAEHYNPAYTGEVHAHQKETNTIDLDARKVIGRRALLELKKGGVINLGIGMPEMVSQVAAEEGLLNSFTLSVEPGGIGGQPASGLSFGAVTNATSVIDQPAQFDFYDGGGLDQAFLGLAETCPQGHVNVSRFGPKLAGAGGFINITQNTQQIFFLGTFTSGKQEQTFEGESLQILSNGKQKKFCQAVQQITFNGEYAIQKGQEITFITERAVFRLTENGLLLEEIAPGVDLEQDILAQMDFTPEIAENLIEMDHRLFRKGPMNIRHPGSVPVKQLRSIFQGVASYQAEARPTHDGPSQNAALVG
ncbi:acyl CoA:acetate/3-ketoacid CoA transferase [Oceanospirillum linum]|uniref:Acetate CoA-transferase YdiF n=1 Tax=Oceanospirillum linum TaxID=966 RepID=A0A1T1HCD5_OCELI|nr:CoA-transferase [Oceanospirillum linum]OOV87400.1 acyl CoA:acetate/3-ketoacid CoA transferase [Oceanospirillum linum]SEF73080.1 propionate CoA-transferase [Oleiphilus messinensis]SMP16125.1 propionate CoA-transferase [Oceanospirillum linum]